MTTLHHIKKIEICEASALTNIILSGDNSCRIDQSVNFTEINIVGLADANVESAQENNQVLYTTTVSYKTKDKTLDGKRKVAFLLTSINGNRYLVGTHMRPYPVMKESNPFPSNPVNSILKEVTVTWKNVTPMLSVL